MHNNISSDQIIQNFKQISDKYCEILTYLSEGKTTILPASFIDSNKLNSVLVESYKQFLEKPERFMEINIDYMQKFQSLAAGSFAKFTGQNTEDNANSDKRFKDQAWHDSVYFNFIKEFYLLSSEFVKKYRDKCDFDDDLKKYADFQVNQILNALSPTNFIFANPKLAEETMDSNWQNIVKGLENFLSDLKKSKDIFTIPISNNSVFKKGENIAASKGKVIFQNKLMQLICYEPKNRTHAIPLLIIPPWINKYYILDLSEHNSLVKFLIDNDFQLFMVSWVNPDEQYKDIDFEDYLKLGIIEPIEYLHKHNIKTLNALGYCIGGTLLASALAYFKAQNLNYINSATFLATLLDYENSGEIGVFINKATIGAIEEEMDRKGYLDGRYLSNSFSLLRSNDLIWSFFVNNYLRGRNPGSFDLLYWNADHTNLPAKMHSYYLRNMYLNNLLKKPGALTMLGTPIDLSLVDNPSFFVATSSDHIAPWKSVYDSALLFKTNQTFCLGSSGHVAGIVNPPANNKYNYKTNSGLPKNADEWLKGASEYKGSWWNHWLEWLKINSKAKTKSLDYKSLSEIEPAPGRCCVSG
jgi:polyhydroxyalkanoate synthase subunit PhaC